MAHQSPKKQDTGHFRVTMTPKSGAPAVMDLANGQTEVWLAPPRGSYRVQLELFDNADPDRSLVPAVIEELKVL